MPHFKFRVSISRRQLDGVSIQTHSFGQIAAGPVDPAGTTISQRPIRSDLDYPIGGLQSVMSAAPDPELGGHIRIDDWGQRIKGKSTLQSFKGVPRLVFSFVSDIQPDNGLR